MLAWEKLSTYKPWGADEEAESRWLCNCCRLRVCLRGRDGAGCRAHVVARESEQRYARDFVIQCDKRGCECQHHNAVGLADTAGVSVAFAVSGAVDVCSGRHIRGD